MSRFRKLEQREEEYWMRCKDKVNAFNQIKQRREQMGNKDERIPYYVIGNRCTSREEPIYHNGRLIKNQYAQKRVYLDWVIAEQTDLFKGEEK